MWKSTLHKRRIVSFKEGETRKEEAFYEKARENRIVRKTSRRFKVITLSEEESSRGTEDVPLIYLVGISGAGHGEDGARATAAVCNQFHPALICFALRTRTSENLFILIPH